MKTRIWCQSGSSFDKTKYIHGKLVWQGNLEVIPRVDEFVTIYEGWAGERVKAVFYELWDNSVMIEIGTDYNDEYPEVEISPGS